MEHLYQRILKYWDISSQEWLYVSSSKIHQYVKIIEAPNELEAAYQVWLTCDLDEDQILFLLWNLSDLETIKKVNRFLDFSFLSRSDFIKLEKDLKDDPDLDVNEWLSDGYYWELCCRLRQPDLGRLVKFVLQEEMVTKEELKEYLNEHQRINHERLTINFYKLDDLRKKPILEQIKF